MGIDLSKLEVPKGGGACNISFGIRFNGGGMSQSCSIMRDQAATVFEIILQNGTRESYVTPIEMTLTPDWPWQLYRG
jgi:hypothetical protein